jgi:DNA-binding NtrC family response regulator
MIAKNEFRQDLFDRLNGADLRVPPLRERKSEILPLAKLFLSRSDDGKSIDGFDEDAERALTAYGWPGNVRELRNAVERAAAIETSPCISLDSLPEAVRVVPEVEQTNRLDAYEGTFGEDHRQAMEHIEAQRFLDALRKANWKPQVAADALGMPRRTFDFRLRKLRIRRQPDTTYAREPEADAGETNNDDD